MVSGSVYEGSAPVQRDAANGSHWGFIFWLVVYVVVAAAILGGLQIGGFSFVFRHR